MGKTQGERLAVIENNLEGNGREGYYSKVDKHEKFFQRIKGVMWLLGISNTGVIILHFFGK